MIANYYLLLNLQRKDYYRNQFINIFQPYSEIPVWQRKESDFIKIDRGNSSLDTRIY